MYRTMAVYKVSLLGTFLQNNQPVVNTLWYRDAFPDILNVIPNDVMGVAEMVYEQVWGGPFVIPPANYTLRSVMPENYRLDAIRVQAADALGEFFNTGSYIFPVGELGGDGLGNFADPRIHYTLTALFDMVGGSLVNMPSKGRLYFGPVKEVYVDENGNVSPAVVSLWQSVAVRLGENLERLTPTPLLVFPVRARRNYNPITDAYFWTVRDVSGWNVSTAVGFLRSRRAA